MNRRFFLSWFGLGLIASSLPAAIAACSSDSASSDAAPRADGFASVGTVDELNQTGSLPVKKIADKPVAVVRDPKNAQAVIAVNPTCTHQGCTVDWQKGDSAFVCPCHGSKFSAGGQVVNGPATRPLPTYPVKVEGDQVLVKVA